MYWGDEGERKAVFKEYKGRGGRTYKSSHANRCVDIREAFCDLVLGGVEECDCECSENHGLVEPRNPGCMPSKVRPMP